MKQVLVPRAARDVRLLATLVVAAGLATGLAGVARPSEARAQAAGLDEYRFPAGNAVQGPGDRQADAGRAGGATEVVDLPGGYPVTAPVLVFGILLGAGIAGGVVVTLRRRARVR